MAYRPRGWGWFVAVSALTGLSGCGYGSFEWNYVYSAVGGELCLLASAVPIEDALDDPTLTDEQKEKLRVVIEVRDYAANVIGLNVAGSYRTFANLQGEPLAWNLSASPKDKIEAYTWNLPFAGPIPYLGFFSVDDAYRERDRLVARGYDTLVYELDAYSTVGLLADPLTSALLDRPTYSLIDTVFHELAHNTVYTGRDSVFDESLATFVGRTAATQYMIERYGPDGEVTVKAFEHFADSGLFNLFLASLRAELDAVYARDIGRDEKIAARGPIFDAARQRMADEILPQMHDPTPYEGYTTFNFNNAFILVNVRYNTEPGLFSAIHERTGRDWAGTLGVLRQAAGAPDPFAFLRGWLAE